MARVEITRGAVELIVYEHVADEGRVVILTIQDARSSTSVTNG